MAEIPLSQGKVAIVDDSDLALVSNYKWHAAKRRTVWYAATVVKAKTRCGITLLYMHKLIFGVDKGRVDHRNGNGLDNRRSNLRAATRTQNSQNSAKRHSTNGTPPPSPYKGVSISRSKRNPWRARIKVERQEIILGYYKTQEEAARAYDAAALKYFGEFARLNFPPPDSLTPEVVTGRH